MSEFHGFPPELFDFFTDLEVANTKSFWRENKKRWEHDVRKPMRSLLADLSNEFGPLRMFRPNRDVRFSADKSPYKLWTGATSESRAVGGIGYYLEVSATRIVTGYGAMLMTADQVRRFRAAIDESRRPAHSHLMRTCQSLLGIRVTRFLTILTRRPRSRISAVAARAAARTRTTG